MVQEIVGRGLVGDGGSATHLIPSIGGYELEVEGGHSELAFRAMLDMMRHSEFGKRVCILGLVFELLDRHQRSDKHALRLGGIWKHFVQHGLVTVKNLVSIFQRILSVEKTHAEWKDRQVLIIIISVSNHQCVHIVTSIQTALGIASAQIVIGGCEAVLHLMSGIILRQLDALHQKPEPSCKGVKLRVNQCPDLLDVALATRAVSSFLLAWAKDTPASLTPGYFASLLQKMQHLLDRHACRRSKVTTCANDIFIFDVDLSGRIQ